jgi:hypothetical protein
MGHAERPLACPGAPLQQALTLYRNIGHRLGQADALIRLGTVHRLTGDYPAAAASQQQCSSSSAT